MVLALLRGQLPVLAQFPGQVGVGFWFLWGLTLGHGLGSFASFRVILGSTLLVGLASHVTLAFHSQYW